MVKIFKILNRDQIKAIEHQFQIKLPLQYINYLDQNGYAEPFKSDFIYFDRCHQKERLSGIGAFLNFNFESYNSILRDNLLPPEFFPKDIIAFAEVGNGDYICFDYRQGKDNINPPIVYWSHGADIGKDVSFIADNFEAFMNILSEPDDLI